MKKRRRRRLRKARRNPLGPLTGRPVLAGVLAWLAVGAVGNVAANAVAQAKLAEIPPEQPGLENLRRHKQEQAVAWVGAVGIGTLVAQVVASLAAYRAAKV